VDAQDYRKNCPTVKAHQYSGVGQNSWQIAKTNELFPAIEP
jgi:hypothetical protein